DRVLVLVTYADGHSGDSSPVGEAAGSTVQDDVAPTLRRPRHLDRSPRHAVRIARPKDLHCRFLRGEPRREPLTGAVGVLTTIPDLRRCKDPLRISVAELLERRIHVADANEIDADHDAQLARAGKGFSHGPMVRGHNGTRKHLPQSFPSALSSLRIIVGTIGT